MALLRCDREWTTEGVKPNERFAYWREAVHEVLLPMNLEQSRDNVFSGHLACHAIDQLALAHAQCDPQIVERTHGNIARGRESHFFLICPVSGSARVDQFGRSTLVGPRECALAFSDERFRLDFFTDANVMTAQIPWNFLANRTSGIFDLTAVNLARETSVGGALVSFVHSLPENRLRGDKSGAVALANSLVDLIGLAAREARSGDPAPLQRKRISGDDLVRFIEVNLADPLMSPAKAGRALAISERSVHLAMREIGVSFMTYVRDRRLDRVAAALKNVDAGSRSISQIAFECGFSDLTTFNRAFRDRFQMSPRVYARVI